MIRRKTTSPQHLTRRDMTTLPDTWRLEPATDKLSFVYLPHL